VDAACQNTRIERKESSRATNPDRSVTRSETIQTETVDCPVTATTTAFGLITSDGRFLRFDSPSNTRVIQIVQSDQGLSRHLEERIPLSVSVIGTADGDVAVVESLSPQGGSSVITREETYRVVEGGTADAIFDVHHNGDHGKLVVTAKGVNFEDLSDADHSQAWSYAQIKELEREDGNKIKIEPHSGDSFEFRVERGMSDTVYRTIADRIVAARGR
jgi:hypothetical protein